MEEQRAAALAAACATAALYVRCTVPCRTKWMSDTSCPWRKMVWPAQRATTVHMAVHHVQAQSPAALPSLTIAALVLNSSAWTNKCQPNRKPYLWCMLTPSGVQPAW